MKVLIEKSVLMNKLIENKTNHVSQANEAREKFRQEAIASLTATLEKFNSGTVEDLHLYEAAPASHEQDYVRAIQMLELHQSDKIELDTDTYRRYVQDEWDWKRVWTASNSKYLSN